MKGIIASELQRMWNKKIIFLSFIALPIISILSAKYYLGHNLKVDVLNPQYTSFGNFPAAAIQEQLMTVFNIIVVLITVFTVNYEYRNGQMRMVLLHSKDINKIFWGKFISILVTLFIFITFYYISSLIVGYITLPKLKEVSIFFHSKGFSIREALIYSLKYYGIALITLCTMASVITFLSIISKTTTTALGTSVGFIVASLIYAQFFQVFQYNYKMSFLSLTQIQYQGIAILLSQSPMLIGLMSIILIAYNIIFITLSYIIFTKRDYLY